MDWLTIFTAFLTVAMILVVVLDTTRYIIPNTLNLALLAAYPFAAYFLGLDWPMALLAAGIVLAVGMLIFALGLMGGGDIKLLVVLSLWSGWHIATLNFLLYTALFGGLLVVIILLARFILPPLWRLFSLELPRILRHKQPVPYGIAIALAFLWLLHTHQIHGLS